MLVLTVVASALAGPVDRVPEDFPTIQHAIDEGSAPVISVGPGEWRGAVVDRPVTVQARPGAVITNGLRGPGARYGFGLTGEADGTVIRGFTFDCRSQRLHLGVYASRVNLPGDAADDVLVAENTFLGCTQGVTNTGHPRRSCQPATVDGGANWVIEGNVFDGIASRGITAEGGGIGIYLLNVRAADVVDNRFRGRVDDNPRFATSGVGLAGCWDCVVAANDFAVTGGVHDWTAVNNLGFYQPGAAASENVLITQNDASRDSKPVDGLSFLSWDSFGTTIDDNVGAARVDHDRCGDGLRTRVQNDAFGRRVQNDAFGRRVHAPQLL